MRIGHHIPKSLVILSVAFLMSACGKIRAISQSNVDRQAPLEPVSLSWLENTPWKQNVVTASWTPSISKDFAKQSIQFFSDAHCSVQIESKLLLAKAATSQQLMATADGAYSYQVYSYDQQGNENVSRCSDSIVIDTTAPQLAITVPSPNRFINLASDSPNFKVSGTCSEAGRMVKVLVDGIEAGSATCQSGVFDTSLQDLSSSPVNTTNWSSGLHEITANMTDEASNFNSSEVVSVKRDVTAPESSSSLHWVQVSPVKNLNVTASWTKSGSSDLSQQSIQFYSGSCAVKVGSEELLDSSTVTKNFVGANGQTYSYRIKSIDEAGNETESACSEPMVIDTSAPMLTITHADEWVTQTNHTSYVVGGTCSDFGTGINGFMNVVISDGVMTKSGSVLCLNGLYERTFNLPGGGALSEGLNHISVSVFATDFAGNQGSVTKDSISQDTVNPLVSITLAPAWVNEANQAAYSIGGTCSDATSGINGNVSVTMSDGTNAAAASAPCLNGTFSASVNATGLINIKNGISITATVTDVMGYSTTSTAIMRSKDSIPPVLSITSPIQTGFLKVASSIPIAFTLVEQNASSTQNFNFRFNNGSSVNTVSIPVTNGPFSAGSPGIFSQSISTTGLGEGTPVSVTIEYSDLAGNAVQVKGDYVIDSQAPTVTAFSINNGSSTTVNNYVKIALSAQDSFSKVSKFCLIKNDSTPPADTDSCWMSATQPNTNATPGLNIAFTGYDYIIGFIQASYTLYAWVMDEAGNRSSLSALGAGTAGTDRASIYYFPGTPPSITALSVTNTDTPNVPATISEKTFTTSSDLFIKWNASDAEGLAANPISIYYSTNNTTYQVLFGMSDIANEAGADCTLRGGYTGCRKLTAPTNGFFRIRIVVKDANGTTTQYNSDLLNDSNLNIIAGNMESGLGGSALSAVFNTIFTNYSSAPPGKHRLAVSEDGRIFYNDRVNGLLSINPVTGVVDQFIRVTGVSSTDASGGSPVSSATLRSILGITMDHSNQLLIYDYDRIRRVNLNTMTITTMIGGGSTLIQGSDFIPTVANPTPSTPLPSYSASSVKLGTTNHYYYTSMIPMPNGDLYFTTDYSTQGFVDRKYIASTNMVDPIAYTGGQGYSNLPNGSWTIGEYLPLKTYGSDLVFSYDPSVQNSPISYPLKGFLFTTAGSSIQYYSRIDFNSNYAGVGPYDLNNLNNSYGTTGLDGKMYFSQRYRYAVLRYDPVTNTSQKILGTTSQREGEPCTDGTIATSCQVNIDSYFINKSGRLFFVDQGLIRTINDLGQVITLYGQYASYGQSVSTLNSRFGMIASFKLDTSVSPKRVVVLDSYLGYYRDVQLGGNTQTLTFASYDGNGTYKFLMDDSGNFYAPNYSTAIKKFTRSTGVWTTVVGGGSTDYFSASADGLFGTQVRFNGSYSGGMLGWYGTKMMLEKRAWNGTNYNNCFAKMYDISDSFRQSNLIGVQSNPCVLDFTLPKTMDQLGLSYAYSLSNIVYEPAFDGGKFIFGRKNNQIFKSTEGGNVELVGTLTSGHVLTSFVHTFDAVAGLTLYYCSNNIIYKWNQSTGSTALPWKPSGLSCTTVGLELNETNGVRSLLVPVTQNGLYGIAEYTLP